MVLVYEKNTPVLLRQLSIHRKHLLDKVHVHQNEIDCYRLGTKVFGVSEGMETMKGAKKSIEAVSEFCFHTLGLAPTLTDLKIDKTYFKAMAEHACIGGAITGPMELHPEDVEKIYEMCL